MIATAARRGPDGGRAGRFLQRLGLDRPAPAEHEPDTLVLWVFCDYEGRWRVRREGQRHEAAFASRREALRFARATGRTWGSYRLFFQLEDGRMIQELLNLSRG